MRLKAQYVFSQNQTNKDTSDIKKKPGMAGEGTRSKNIAELYH